MAKRISTTTHKNIISLCNTTGLSLLEDVASDGPGEPRRTVYYLAEFEHRFSGMPTRIMTPFCRTLDELDAWCEQRRKKAGSIKGEQDGPSLLTDVPPKPLK